MDADAGPAVSRHMHDDEEERHDDTKEGPPAGRFQDPSFVDELRGIYLQHFRALQESDAPRRRGRPALRLPQHVRPALVAALTLLFAGVAVAAVTLSLKHSAPLSGRLPPQANTASWGFGFTEAGSHYRIVFAPTLAAGTAGWMSFVYLGAHERRSRTGGGGGYPSTGMPLLPGATSYLATDREGGKIVHYVLTGPSVAAVAVGSQTIRTRNSHALPAGDHVAVFTLSVNVPVQPPAWLLSLVRVLLGAHLQGFVHDRRSHRACSCGARMQSGLPWQVEGRRVS